MELSIGLRQTLLHQRPELLAQVDALELPLIAAVLQRATGLYRVNCHHPDNQQGSLIRALVGPPPTA
jgi:hypothetical protein